MAAPLPEVIQTAIVTGGSSGLGAAIVRALHREGFRVVIADRQADAGAALASSLDLAGETAVTVTLDPTNPADYRTALDRCIERWGSVEVLVHAAGGGAEEIEAGNAAIAPHLRDRAYGRIIALARGDAGQREACAARIREMAGPLASLGVTCNALLLREPSPAAREAAFTADLAAMLARPGAQGVSGAAWEIPGIAKT